MKNRYEHPQSSLLPHLKIRLCAALQETLQKGYSIHDFRSDVMSGIVIGMVAIPLGMALAIASGVSPEHGLYTVVIAGGLVALLGGSKFQVTGPTAAFVVILAPIVHKFGVSGLMTAGLMAGVILIIMGAARLGRFIQFIPYPVTTGFTSGIAVVIATLQIKDFFGLEMPQAPDEFFKLLVALFDASGSWSPVEFGIGSFTLALLILWPKINSAIPAPLVVLSMVTSASLLLGEFFPELEFATIGNRFTSEQDGEVVHGIPSTLPRIGFPWKLGNNPLDLSFDTIRSLVPSAFAIAILGAIESLLSAVVADGMTRTRHDPDSELVALGIGNIACPFFGGIPATGAIARTATNIRYGARSPISAIVHAGFTLAVVLLFASFVSYLPMAALAALLMLIACNMSEAKHFVRILRVAPKSDALVLLLCFSLTVIFDMVVGVTVGIVFAAMLFMDRMASLTSGRKFVGTRHSNFEDSIPDDTLVYEISGPFFFGAAESATSAIRHTNEKIRNVVFLMENVPVMDVTGLVAFESVVEDLRRQKARVFVIGLRAQPASLMNRSKIVASKQIEITDSMEKVFSSIQSTKKEL